MNAQAQLWHVLDAAGPWLWIVKPILCALAFGILLMRTPPACWLERVARFLCFVGLVGIVLAIFNTALGPVSDVLFFSGYALTLLHRRIVEYRAGARRPPTITAGGGGPHAVVAFVLCALALVAVPALAFVGVAP